MSSMCVCVCVCVFITHHCIFTRLFLPWAVMFTPSIYFDPEWGNSLRHSSHLNGDFSPPAGLWELSIVWHQFFYIHLEKIQGGKRDCPPATVFLKDRAGWQAPCWDIWLISQPRPDTLEVCLDCSPDRAEPWALGTSNQLSTAGEMFTNLLHPRVCPQLCYICSATYLHFFQFKMFLQHHFWGLREEEEPYQVHQSV